MLTTPRLAGATLLVLFSLSARADQVISDNLIVYPSLCAGSECAADETFGFDTIRLKTDNPLIRFEDTSGGTFPTNDWSLGIADHAEGEPTRFFINDESGASSVLILEGSTGGGIALGAGASLESGAISVGASGSERRIAHVADGVEDSDAVTLGQFNTFKTTVNDNFADQLASDRAEVDAEISALQDDLQALTTRLDDLVAQLGLN